ncbi:MAG TPA: MarR family transcriptional regulator [Steroidobacteraceae bacterium]|nr:MarR family transcriptional regulator [Steroidobacteraceae bacterium]
MSSRGIRGAAAGAMPVAQARIAYSVGRLERALRRRLALVTRRFGLTVAQYTALSVLHARGALSNAELARRSFVSPQAMNELLAALARARMIVRRPDERHGRIVQMTLTPRGARTLAGCDAAVAAVEERMLAELSQAARARLRENLRRCIAALER